MAASTALPQRRRRNRIVVAGLILIVVGMGTLVYYSVPLYRLFCEVTGFGGTTQAAQSIPTEIVDREVTVRFDANVSSGLPWQFIAPKPVKVRLGEEGVVSYKGKNIGVKPYLGTATFNVTPFKAGRHFNKIECFCFTEQLLQPGEEKEFPVSFFVDPALAKDINANEVTTITLSYTFFDQGINARDRYMREHNILSRSNDVSTNATSTVRGVGIQAKSSTSPLKEMN